MSHFNEIANQWDTPENVARSTVFGAAIRPFVPPAARMMELGCGTGLLTFQFANGAKAILGVDTSEGMLEVFARKAAGVSNVTHARCNLETEDLPRTEPFDVIASTMAFHHLQQPAAMVKKLAGMLSNRGTLAIIDLETEDGTFHPDNAKMGVKHFGFSRAQLDGWAAVAGLNAPQVSTIHTVDKNHRGYPLFLAVFRR